MVYSVQLSLILIALALANSQHIDCNLKRFALVSYL
ncbi:unnamed protein product [Soboliphyme baturini]|uniref:Secreted protein n=1 Tax=Soboliphyme baturini TaxID=241478 RepID=A0A183J9H2_9BILA|nr:unnamed protein product [Soboliphyme baturini]